MTEFARLDELTRIRNDFHRKLMRQPPPNRGGGRRVELSEDCSRIEEARIDETVRLLREGIPADVIREHLRQPGLLSPAETGIPVPAGEAEAHFAAAEAQPEAEAEAELDL
jgi:hypothetical protein